jgi:hypothetical protein
MPKYNEADWCAYSDYALAPPKGKKLRKVRCPVCRKRMIPRTLDAEPFGKYFEPYCVIPRHKKPHGKR